MEMMQKKNILNSFEFICRLGFFLLFFFLFSSCASQTVKNHGDFYKGLLIPDTTEEKIKLYESALNDSNKYVRQAAADELAVLMSHGTELSARMYEKVSSEVSVFWASAFEIAEKPNKDKILSFLLGFEQNAFLSFDEPRSYALRELHKQRIFFTPGETAVIEGHYAISRLRYGEAINHFRYFQIDKKWPEQMPGIFSEYPNLINDLGRAFQYTQSGSEGLDLFLQWEKNLPRVSAGASDDLRYRLLFYAGRIARRVGGRSSAQAAALFEQTLPLAPDYEQQDACIWYILDLSLTGPINIIAEKMERLIPLWYSASYFNSIMERYLHRLVSAREWRRVIQTYNLLKDIEDSSIKSGYAWVIARLIQEGYLSAEDRNLASAAANMPAADAAIYMRIAYNTSNTLQIPALYYRMQSSAFLGLPFLDLIESSSCNCPQAGLLPSSALRFLLDFFYYNAGDLAAPYIRRLENLLNTHELRILAQTLDDAGMHPQSMRIVSLYINREDHCIHRQDLELMYPRPYLELIEKNARQFDIAPSLVYGLIRTESAFQNAIASHAGAVGLMQLMPATAREQAKRIRNGGGPDFLDSEENVDRTDIDANLYIGSFYYNYLFKRFNDHQLALMSYNGGETRVNRWRNASSLPIDLLVETVAIYETRDYGKRVPAIGKIYEELYYR